MSFEEASDFVVAADGVEIEVFWIQAFKDEADFQPAATLIKSIAQVTDAESPMAVGHAKISADSTDDFTSRLSRFWR